MRKKSFKWDFWSAVTLVIVLLFALVLVYPLFSLFISGFQDPHTSAFSLANFARFFQKKYYYQTLLNSFKVTCSVTLLAIVIGAPLAYFMTCFKIKGKGLVEVLIIISMLSPPFIGAYSWVLLGGRSGVITRFMHNVFGIEMPSIYGFWGKIGRAHV